MMNLKWFAFLLVLFSASACAPVVYDSTYQGHITTRVHLASHDSYEQPYYRKHSNRPVQITIYADNSYRGFYFQPIQIVVYDGDYIEIPLKNRRGHLSRIFAHYHQDNLHFDSSKSCQRIPGSSGYRYDASWDNGRKYNQLNAGSNYDLSGLRMKVHSSQQKTRNTAKSVKLQEKRGQVVKQKSHVKSQARPIVINKFKTKKSRKATVINSSHDKPKTVFKNNKQQTIKKTQVTNIYVPENAIGRKAIKPSKVEKIKKVTKRENRRTLKRADSKHQKQTVIKDKVEIANKETENNVSEDNRANDIKEVKRLVRKQKTAKDTNKDTKIKRSRSNRNDKKQSKFQTVKIIKK